MKEIDGINTEEKIAKWNTFNVNEVVPRIKKNIPTPQSKDNIEWEEYWKNHFEASLFGSDMFKLKEAGYITTIQVRMYLDKYIGKLRNEKAE